MTGVGFLILFCFSCLLFQCKGNIISPPVGTEYVFKPGETREIKWEFNGNPAFRSWSFTSSADGSSTGLLATISQHGGTNILNRLFEFDIERPATLVLKNVNQSYDGVYQFSLTVTKASTSDVKVFIAKKPNVILSCPSYNEVNESDDFTCECRGKYGNPPSNVTWYKNGNKFGDTKAENNTLILSNVNETRSGNYKCEARSHTGDEFADAKTIQMQVLFTPNAKLTFGPECYLLGGSCIVMCDSSGFPVPSHTISHNGVVVTNTKTHTIHAVKYSDAGIYKCIAKNVLGSDSASANLTVRGQLSVTVDCFNPVTVNEGDDFTCACTNEDGNFSANLTWYKNGKRIGNASYGQQNRLIFTDVTKHDSGNYSCEAQRYAVKNGKFVEVKVTFKPRNTTINIEIKTGSDGVSVVTSITCNSDGFPEPNYNMTLDGIMISSGKVNTISAMQPFSASGKFKCIAWNNYGSDSASKILLGKVTCSKEGCDSFGTVVVWHIVVTLLSGIIIGILFSYIVLCSRRRWSRNRKPERNSEPQTDGVDTTYQELDLTKMNKEDNYQSLRGNVAVRASNDVGNNDQESTYTQLSKTRDVESNYQSLTN